MHAGYKLIGLIARSSDSLVSYLSRGKIPFSEDFREPKKGLLANLHVKS